MNLSSFDFDSLLSSPVFLIVGIAIVAVAAFFVARAIAKQVSKLVGALAGAGAGSLGLVGIIDVFNESGGAELVNAVL